MYALGQSGNGRHDLGDLSALNKKGIGRVYMEKIKALSTTHDTDTRHTTRHAILQKIISS